MLRLHDENNDIGNPCTLNETASFKGKMQASDKKHAYSYTVVEDIHNYAKKITWTKKRLAKMPQGGIGIRFIDKLKLVGLSDARLCYYGDRVPRLLDEFEKLGVKLKDAKKKDCEAVLSAVLNQKYKGETKVAFAMTLMRLVYFGKKRYGSRSK